MEKQMLKVRSRENLQRVRSPFQRTGGNLDSEKAWKKGGLVCFVNQSDRPGECQKHYCVQEVVHERTL